MRHRSIRNVVIELTSLLDVVMILIFAVLIQNAKLVEENNKKMIELQEENLRMQGDLDNVLGNDESVQEILKLLDEEGLDKLIQRIVNDNSIQNAYEYMDEVVVVYNVGLENRSSGDRYLTYGKAGSDYSKTVLISKSDKENWTTEKNNFSINVNDFVKNEMKVDSTEKYIYIVFSVDESKVYRNDFVEIDSVLRDLENKYGVESVRYRVDYLEE